MSPRPQRILAILLLPGLLLLTLFIHPVRPPAAQPIRSPRTFPFSCRWTSTPCLIVEPSVDATFASLAAQTWTAFLTAFAPLASGLDDVHLQASYTLPARAGYDPATATVTVRVPGSPAKLRAALVHEWAHHLEFQRPDAIAALRPTFLAAEGFPPDAAWRPASASTVVDSWADMPSEHFAEAAIEFVLGHNATPTQIHVRQEAVNALADWVAEHGANSQQRTPPGGGGARFEVGEPGR